MHHFETLHCLFSIVCLNYFKLAVLIISHSSIPRIYKVQTSSEIVYKELEWLEIKHVVVHDHYFRRTVASFLTDILFLIEVYEALRIESGTLYRFTTFWITSMDRRTWGRIIWFRQNWSMKTWVIPTWSVTILWKITLTIFVLLFQDNV